MKDKLRSAFSRYWETAAIIILIFTAMFLAYRLYSSAVPGSRSDETSSGSPEEETTDEVLRSLSVPLRMTIRSSSDELTGIMYNDSLLSSGSEHFSAVVAEAIGSASSPEELREEEWKDLLSCCGITFGYEEKRSFEILAAAFGTDCPDSLLTYDAVFLVLCSRNGTSCLAFKNENGDFYSCTTGADSTALETLCAGYEGNGCYFAYENELLSDVPPYSLIDESISEGTDVVSSSALTTDAELENLYSVMNISDKTGSNFTESDGTRVIVSGNATLRMDGCEITYKKNLSSASAITEAQAVEAALSCTEEIFRGSMTAARLYVSSVTENSLQKTWTIYLDYYVNGSPVVLNGRDFALEMEVGDKGICYLSGCLRLYSQTGETVLVIPMLQAAAAAGVSGGCPVLSYFDDMSNMTLGWMTGENG